MSRWFRFYDTTLDDPKVQRLSDKLFRTWVNILCIASRNHGSLPSVSDIAFLMRLSDKETSGRLGELRKAGLVDDDPETGASPHNWKGRQFRSDGSTERVKRFRERCETPKRNVSETLPKQNVEQDQSTESDTESDTESPFPNGKGTETPDVQLYRRGKQVLGASSAGQITKLLKAKNGNVALATAAIEIASTKQNPGQYVGGILRNQGASGATDDWIT